MVNKIHNPRGAGRKKEKIDIILFDDGYVGNNLYTSTDNSTLIVDGKSVRGDRDLIQRIYRIMTKRQKNNETQIKKRRREGK